MSLCHVRLADERRRYEDKLWISIMAGVVLSDLDFAINKVSVEWALLLVISVDIHTFIVR